LFFWWIVAKNIWHEIIVFFGKATCNDLVSVAHYWVADDKYFAFNPIYMCWCVVVNLEP
jgi:hypothetical protein